MPEHFDGGSITHNEVGHLPPLTGEEHLALLTALAQVGRGEEVTPKVARTIAVTLARLAGIDIPDSGPSLGSPPSIGNIDTTPDWNHDDPAGATPRGNSSTPKPGPHLAPVREDQS